MERRRAVAVATTTDLRSEMTHWRPDRLDAQGKTPGHVRTNPTPAATFSKTVLRLAANQHFFAEMSIYSKKGNIL
ncbi:hypothetical protein HBI33_217170 [Parastagonospora nodorum]|nr:hypothetical protein HBI33_217170 [Parastagonospora nodorum]